MADFREVAARAGRRAKIVTEAAKLLGGVALGVWCVVALVSPVRFSPTAGTPSWFVSLVEYVAQQTGWSSQTAASVIVRLFWAGMAVCGVGVTKEAWEDWEHGWKPLAGVLAAAVAVVGVAVLAIFNAPDGVAVAGKFYYPATLSACGWLALLVVIAFMQSGGAPMSGRRMPDGSENARYLAIGLALLAVVALALWRSQKNLASVGNSLPQFFAGLPWHYDLLPWPHLIGLLVLALLAVVGLFRLATGRRGPFPKRGLRGAGWDIFWLLAGAGLWLWGAFLPPDFGWFDILDIPGGATYAVNFGLLALYLFIVVESAVTIALLVGGGGSAGGEIGGNTGWRNRPMTPGRR